jgi:hypothetical protein
MDAFYVGLELNRYSPHEVFLSRSGRGGVIQHVTRAMPLSRDVIDFP